MTITPATPVPPRWLHALAVLTVLLTLPLLILGASVTSYDVGMVDARGFRWPWEIVRGLFENNGLGWLLEYGHRTFGFLVGICGIGLAIGCWFYGRGIAWVGVLALAMICAQGALGAFRVEFNALFGRSAAMIHGAFAQLVFATLVAVALFTSRRWTTDPVEPASPALARWSIITMLIVFAQLVLGGLVRHQQDNLIGPRGHLLGAFVVVGAVVWLLKVMKDDAIGRAALTPGPSPRERGEYRAQRILLMVLLTFQIWLGIESWLAKFFWASAANQQALLPIPTHAEWIRTAHYLTGTLIFATTVTVALIAHRRSAVLLAAEPMRPLQLEGAL